MCVRECVYVWVSERCQSPKQIIKFDHSVSVKSERSKVKTMKTVCTYVYIHVKIEF